MSKKIFFLLIVSLILTTTVFAQKTDNFLGTWKLAESNKWTNELNIKSLTINVSETDNNLIIERDIQKIDSSFTSRVLYKTTGATTTELVGGRFGGVETSFMRFVKPDRLEFLRDFRRDNDSYRNREIWTLSEDGKTLTVTQRGNYAFGKMIFTKQ